MSKKTSPSLPRLFYVLLCSNIEEYFVSVKQICEPVADFPSYLQSPCCSMYSQENILRCSDQLPWGTECLPLLGDFVCVAQFWGAFCVWKEAGAVQYVSSNMALLKEQQDKRVCMC